MQDQKEDNTKEETTSDTLTIKKAQSLAAKTFKGVEHFVPSELGSVKLEKLVEEELVIIDGHMEAIDRSLCKALANMSEVDTENKVLLLELLLDQVRSLVSSMLTNDKMKCEFSLAGILQTVLAASERYKIDLSKVFLGLNTGDLLLLSQTEETYKRVKEKDNPNKHTPGSVLESEAE